MGYSATVIADSTDNHHNHRLTTLILTYPWLIHPQMMTHRKFSRNSASMRAIPTRLMISNVQNDPFRPLWWGKNQGGMQAEGELEGDQLANAKQAWETGFQAALQSATMLMKAKAHKQIASRPLMPYTWIKVLYTASEGGWNNFFHLRCDKHAQPEIREIAFQARDAIDGSTPKILNQREYHLPFISDFEFEEFSRDDLIKLSVARCARVSYDQHDGTRDVQKDFHLHNRLSQNGHWSAFEHVAEYAPLHPIHFSGNFGYPFSQYRKQFVNEYVSKRG